MVLSLHELRIVKAKIDTETESIVKEDIVKYGCGNSMVRKICSVCKSTRDEKYVPDCTKCGKPICILCAKSDDRAPVHGDCLLKQEISNRNVVC